MRQKAFRMRQHSRHPTGCAQERRVWPSRPAQCASAVLIHRTVARQGPSHSLLAIPLAACLALALAGSALAEDGERVAVSPPASLVQGPGWSIPHQLAPCPYNAIAGGCVGPSIYMDAIVRYRANGILYEIPAAYHTAWPTAKDVAECQSNNRGGLPDFAFWMPRRRPELIKTAPPMVWSAIKAAGGSRGDDEYDVTVLSPRFVESDDPDIIHPDRAYANNKEISGGPGDLHVIEFDADRFTFERGKSSSADYHSLPGDNTRFISRCGRDGERPLCSGYVYYRDISLYFFFRFPSGHMKDWRQIFDSVRDLTLGWRKSN